MSEKNPDLMSVRELRASLKKALMLLSLAKCDTCDGSGAIPVQVAPNEWEADQCQWCHERWELGIRT